MKTRRSPRNQEALYRSIGRSLERAASASLGAEEANPDLWPCPDGERCADPECIATKAKFDAERMPNETLGRWFVRKELRHEG